MEALILEMPGVRTDEEAGAPGGRLYCFFAGSDAFADDFDSFFGPEDGLEEEALALPSRERLLDLGESSR